MSTETHQITVCGVRVTVVRKAIKNLHLGVYPPHGRVRVAAPLTVSEEAVRLAVVGKLGWIKRQRARFEAQPRQSRRELVNGESHYFLGRRCRLQVHHRKGPSWAALRGKTVIDLFVRPGATAEERDRILQRWYRAELKALVPPLLEKWQRALGVQAVAWGIKKMKTKWGSCTIDARRLWINLELIKKPVRCLEYIAIHELMHLRERHHGNAFIKLMDKALPTWRTHRAELNRAPLAQENWEY
jgi:predicted metal-dependent hydrolase